MGMLLAVLVLTALGIGFIGLMVLPLFFIWLAVGVYTEPWKEDAPGEVPEHLAVEEPSTPEQPIQVEKPRVMVAGRRRPL